jgi:hypothetical protein
VTVLRIDIFRAVLHTFPSDMNWWRNFVLPVLLTPRTINFRAVSLNSWWALATDVQ